MEQIAPNDWEAIVASLGEAGARQWAATNGVQVPGSGGGPAEAAAPVLPSAQSYDPDLTADLDVGADGDLWVEADGDLSVEADAGSSGLGALSGPFSSLLTARRDRVSELYDDAAKRLVERYRGPSDRELLLSMAASFAQPTENGRFTESLMRIPDTLLKYTQAQRESEGVLAEKQAELELAKSRDELKSEDSILSLAQKYAASGKLKYMVTPAGEVVAVDPTTNTATVIKKSAEFTPIFKTVNGVEMVQTAPGRPWEIVKKDKPTETWEPYTDPTTGRQGLRNSVTNEIKTNPLAPDAKTLNPDEVRSNAKRMIDMIEAAKTHPGLESAVGNFGIFNPLTGFKGYDDKGVPQMIPGSQGEAFVGLAEQVRGNVFMEAFKSLKGAGAISEQEGAAATAAMARLRYTTNPEDFRAALNELETEVKRLAALAIRKAGGGRSQQGQSGSSGRGRIVRTGRDRQGRKVVRYENGDVVLAD